MTPFQVLDALLIAPFRLVAPPEAGFLTGICVLALVSALLGRACAALVSRAQRVRRDHEEAETRRRHELSLEALRAQDKAAYLAQNHLAQEAYGNTLALSAGRAAALLWPGMAALAWLAWRFEGAPMPFLWDSAGPAAWFLPLYALALWASGPRWRKAAA
jgi:hypothetical protein